MIRTILTLIKIALVVGVVVWISENPGTIEIDWLDYKLTFHIGMFIFALFILVVLGIIVFSIIKGALDLPKTLGRYKDITDKDKGLKAVTVGLSAVAAGDVKGASYQAKRAQNLLGDESPLPKLLEAQAARLRGEELDASKAFMALMDDKDGSFLGVRGLLQSALDNGDHKGALELGHKALEDYPKQGWILSIVYDLEVRLHNWKSAVQVLYRAEKAGVIASEKAASDRVAMLIAQADDAKAQGDEAGTFRYLQKAYKTDPSFVPAVIRLGRLYIEREKYKAAASMVEKAWKKQPHPALVALWDEAYVAKIGDETMERVRWFEKLLGFNTKSVEGLQALASVLVQEGLWGEARKYLEQAEELRPNVNLYKLWARLEERATHNDAAVREWLMKAADAPRERVWICSSTGRIYEEWVPISDQGLFNTIIWDFPQGRVQEPSMIGFDPQGMNVPLLGVS